MPSGSATVLESIVGFLDLYAATLTYSVITKGLINSGYRIVEGGLKAAIVSISIEFLDHHKIGYSTVFTPLILATLGIIVLFYPTEAPDAFTSFYIQDFLYTAYSLSRCYI